jgi:hypothetical protein
MKAQREPAQPAAPVRTHHDERRTAVARFLKDQFGHPHAGSHRTEPSAIRPRSRASFTAPVTRRSPAARQSSSNCSGGTYPDTSLNRSRASTTLSKCNVAPSSPASAMASSSPCCAVGLPSIGTRIREYMTGFRRTAVRSVHGAHRCSLALRQRAQATRCLRSPNAARKSGRWASWSASPLPLQGVNSLSDLPHGPLDTHRRMDRRRHRRAPRGWRTEHRHAVVASQSSARLIPSAWQGDAHVASCADSACPNASTYARCRPAWR